ncbi:MAG: hypothetical protein EOO29_09160 [Comamonadaceae bacterium]|nr:MAG: hypothetical protein EOO29_09160 [Comamonadaceae bacterium]
MKRRSFAAAAAPFLAAMLGATQLPACARSLPRPYPQPPTRAGRLLQLGVVDRDSGRELPLYFHEGEYWVAGRPGTRYALRAQNRQGDRLLAVMSVDGLNVLTGERAAVDQNGYVLSGGEQADVAGWRKSSVEIAAFEFTEPGEAYATRTGRPEHLGVIGVALFRERVRRPMPPPSAVLREESSAPTDAPSSPVPGSAGAGAAEAEAPSASARMADRAGASAAPARPAQQLGTGHGAREHAPIHTVSFTRAQSRPDELIRIRYDSHANLVARGVIPATLPRPRPDEPQPFPASPLETGYVPDPPRR